MLVAPKSFTKKTCEKSYCNSLYRPWKKGEFIERKDASKKRPDR